MTTTPEKLAAAGCVRYGSELRARFLVRPPVGAVVARTRHVVEIVARVGLLWQIVETWTRPDARRGRRR